MAARLAISTLAHLHLRLGSWSMRVDSVVASEIMDRSQWLYRLTHEAVLAWYQAHAEVGRMAATMTGVYSAGTNLFVAHVGHSRCYLFRKGVLTQLTRDQTLRERLAESRQPTSVGQGIEDGEHILTSAIGANAETPRIIVEQFRLEDDDTLLLCTNGLTDMVTDEEIADTLASRRAPEELCNLLLDAALTNGGHDNVTVVLANYHIPSLPAPEF
jgi:serine/threonine protein phosphatase PrpC